MVIACALIALLQASEADVYPVIDIEVPAGLVLEVGGIALLSDGRPLVCTRRGEVWLLENAYSDDGQGVEFKLWVDGLQEPLGLLVETESIWQSVYTVQRGELTLMRNAVDLDQRQSVVRSERCDELRTIADPWRISGNYHEYAFGPVRGPDGRLWLTLNRPFGGQPFGEVDWRGFALGIDPESGAWEPICAGLRSPCGITASPWGDVFYTDNQGEWVGTNKLAHLEPGDFHGHPWGIESTRLPEWKYGEIPMPPNPLLMPVASRTIPRFKLPAIWFPYDVMGRSAAGFVWDTEGHFGPFFKGHVFVGDQYDASILRVTLEQVGGAWQGACYPFRMGLASGVTRVCWGADGSLLVGLTNRGWGSRGKGTQGLQRLKWSGETPFELREMRALPDGFELEFTAPFDPERAADPSSYRMSSYTYEFHEGYGSSQMDTHELTPVPTVVDATHVRLVVPGLRPVYVHELHYEGLRSAKGAVPLHDRAYYTLNLTPY